MSEKLDFSLFYDNLDIGILIVNSRLEIVFINSWIMSRLPKPHQPVTNLRELFYGRDNEGLKKILQETITSGMPRKLSQAFHNWIIPLPDKRFTDGLMRQGGSLIPFKDLLLIQIRDDSDVVLRYESLKNTYQKLQALNAELQKEISERKEKERMINDNLLFLSTLIGAIPYPLYYKNAAGEYLGCNKAFEQFTGFRSKDIVGKTVFDLYPIGLAQIYSEDESSMLNNNDQRLKTYQGKARSGDGQVRDMIFYETVYQDINHKAAGIIGSFIDITELKRKEKELLAVKEQAELADRARSEFLSHINHEFRTPLNSMLGFTAILEQDDNLTDDQKSYLSIVNQSGQTLLRLLENIIKYARIEAGRIELSVTDFNLHDMLQQISAEFAFQAENMNIRFISRIDKKLPIIVRNDQEKLKTVISNLLDNALKFTNHGEVVFSADIVDRKIRFCVKDSGIGISQENINNIFGPFKQFHTKEKLYQGMGLGIPICKSYLNLMESELQIESQIGKGSGFYFDLDLLILPGITLENDCLDDKKIIGYIGERKTILIAEDECFNRLLLESGLSRIGFHVIEAQDGEEAVRLIKQHKPDLILMDIQMPALNGILASQVIKQMPEMKNVPIIAISAYLNNEEHSEYQAAGINAYIDKPVHFEQLYRLIGNFLNIKWTYSTSMSASDIQSDSIVLDRELISQLPSSAKKQLLFCANTGNVKELRMVLDQLEEMNSKLLPLIKFIKIYLKQYDFETIIRIFKD